MKAFRVVLVAALALVATAVVPGPVAAQQTESRIVGRLVDDTQGAIPGATVTVTSTQTGAVRTMVSEADGSFSVTNLGPGTYTVLVELPGFGSETRQVTLGLGQVETLDLVLGVAGLQEAVTVSASANVIDLSSAKIGVNVSPEEVQNLPVNGRNFANLMTLATGATSDGNGGWASVRFNGKSNQQNYLNFDGVDGTYVWDASPGYLNATGSQFRLQTSMEAVAEFRVNSGLAPAESGLGAGGNITVVTKSGSNAFHGSLFEYKRDDALDSASKYDDKKQELSLDQFGGSFGGPLRRNRTFIFGSVERLTQKTGLSFTEAVPSAETRRRILAGEPVGSGAGQSPERTRAVAPLLNGFPVGTTPTSNPLLDSASLNTEAKQEETTVSLRFDQRLSDSQSFYVRYQGSDGEVDTPDRTVTPRRVLAKQTPQNVMVNYQSLHGSSLVNEVKVGYNGPQTSALAFAAVDGYDPLVFPCPARSRRPRLTRGAPPVSRAAACYPRDERLLDHRFRVRPHVVVVQRRCDMEQGPHTVKGGFEYRDIASQFEFRGSDELTFNSVTDLIDNRPAAIQVALDSPVFTPKQFYLIGFVQDSWRANSRLTLDLGFRYDYYSVVKEQDGLAKPFFVEDNAFSSDVDNFYNPDRNNFSPRFSATYALDDKTALRGGLGSSTVPVSSRIASSRSRTTSSGAACRPRTFRTTAWRIRCPRPPIATSCRFAAIRMSVRTIQRPVGGSISRELPGAINLTVGYTGSRGKDMFLRGVSNTLDFDTRTRQDPAVGQVDYKTSGCLDGLTINNQAISGCGYASYDALQISTTRRFQSGFTGGLQYQFSRNKGTTQGSNEAATTQNTFDYETEYGTNPQDIPHTFNGSLMYLIPGEGLLTGGWRVGGIVNARSGVPVNVTIARPDNLTVNGATVTNIPGGNSRGTQRPDMVPGVDPYLKDGVRWINPAAFTTPQPGTFGNLARNALRGPSFWQADLMFSKDFRFMDTQGLQIRVEMFNIANRLNYENPAASLPNGTPGVPFTDAQAGTFGYMLGPLNRTVGLGTARQTQISIRYLF